VRHQAAARFGLQPGRPTLLVLGGSQGSRAVNRIAMQALTLSSAQERQAWQVLHVTGSADEQTARQTYRACGFAAWVTAFVADMEDAYALADLALVRAGASTIAELARCGIPAVLIPYPYASGHQRANGGLVESAGGGVMIEERDATPQRVLGVIRRILSDERLRRMMGTQIQTLHHPQAARELARTVLAVAG
jgi:UDP-N-acetylglucosamine--N-acetylmuramyl-(pentapeptide) pyrophosphoryl-undecaprenol N-acetylglucosamine transferase